MEGIARSLSDTLALRHKAYQHFYQAYTYLAETLEMIDYRGHIEKHGNMYSDWDTANRNEAQQILVSITSFYFIVVFMVVYQYLSHLSGITTHLQSTTLDIIQVHSMVGRLLIMYVLYMILLLIYTEVVLYPLACSCLYEMYANGHVPKRTIHNYVFLNSKMYISNNFNFHLKFKFTLELHTILLTRLINNLQCPVQGLHLACSKPPPTHFRPAYAPETSHAIFHLGPWITT